MLYVCPNPAPEDLDQSDETDQKNVSFAEMLDSRMVFEYRRSGLQQ